MKRLIRVHSRLFAAILFSSTCALPDAGVLVPSDKRQPDPSVISLDEMTVDVLIDNGDARVTVRQIFGIHTTGVTEATYAFALPARAAISDFAIWEDVTRIPGVILERRRAEEVYEELKSQAIDPGILQQGEVDEQSGRSNVFSARITPLPDFGTKRIELEYHERIPVEDLRSEFLVPLRPDAYQAQTAGSLRITFELHSRHALRGFQPAGKPYPLRIAEQTPNVVRAVFEGRNVALTEDFGARWELEPPRAPRMDVLAHRDPGEPGFFQAGLLLPRATAARKPRTVVALFDTSLSMQWEKLEGSFRALEALLHSLGPADRFNLLLFNSAVATFSPEPVAAMPAAVEKALAFVRASDLRGGTNLELAVRTALAQSFASEPYLVVISDCGPTRGALRSGNLARAYETAWSRLPEGHRPRTYVFAVGDDANLALGRLLAAQDGLLEWVRSTEPLEFKLNAFLSKMGRRPVDLRFSAAPTGNFDMIYPLEEPSFAGSLASWVGQYRQPLADAVFSAGGASAHLPLPAQEADHPQLPRTWARARVDALLAKIDRDGEDRATIDEIIRLSRKYKFVTPYTTFLAAPHALLRPRVIRPGDPVLRVRTDPAIVSVVALFPFGGARGLRYLKEEDIWQTRFLAPPDLPDGVHQVRLVLRDRGGRVYRESKSFIIASKPPTVRIQLPAGRFRAGQGIPIRVRASRSTRTLVARLYGAAPVELRWNPAEGVSTGTLVVPAALPPGAYRLSVTAEDVAHNIGTGEVPIEVVP